MASDRPRQARRTVVAASTRRETPMYPLKSECCFELILVSEKDRVLELREKYDLVIEVIRRGGTKGVFLLLKEPEGKAVTNLALKRGTVTFARDQPEVLLNTDQNGWRRRIG